jgi:hypothetical protein
MDEFFFSLDCEVSCWNGGTVDVLLNGIPLTQLGGGRPTKFAGIPDEQLGTGKRASDQNLVNEFLFAGDNELVLEVGKLPFTSWAEVLKLQDARAGAVLTRYPFGAIEGGPDGVIIGSVEWRMPPLADVTPEALPAMFPQRATALVNAGDRPGRPWRWEAAERLELSDAVQREALNFVRNIHAALQTGNAGTFIDASEIRLEDLSVSYASFDAAERRDFIRKGTRPGAMAVLVEGEFAPRLCAGGRLLEIRARDGKPFMRERVNTDGEEGFFEMFIGKVNNTWCIVR